MSSSPNCLQQTDEFISRQCRTVAFPRQKQRAQCRDSSSYNCKALACAASECLFDLCRRVHVSVLISVCTACDQSRQNRNGPTQLRWCCWNYLSSNLSSQNWTSSSAHVPQLSFGREEQQHNYAAEKETITKRDEASVARIRMGNEISFKNTI